MEVDIFWRPWEERARDTGEDAGVRDMGGAGEGHGRSAGRDMHSFNPGPPTHKGGLDLFCRHGRRQERARDTGEDAGVSDMGGAGEGHGRWRSAGEGQDLVSDMGVAGEGGHGRSAGEGHAFIQSSPPDTQGGAGSFLRPWEERARDTGEDAGVSDMGVSGRGRHRGSGGARVRDNICFLGRAGVRDTHSFNPGPPWGAWI